MTNTCAYLALAERALAACPTPADRLVVYDALAVAADAMVLHSDATEARALANALRGVETMELDFRNRLQGKRGGAQ